MIRNTSPFSELKLLKTDPLARKSILPLLEKDKVVDAKVLQVISPSRAELLIMGTRVVADTSVPLTRGENVQLKVMDQGKLAILKLMPENKNASNGNADNAAGTRLSVPRFADAASQLLSRNTPFEAFTKLASSLFTDLKDALKNQIVKPESNRGSKTSANQDAGGKSLKDTILSDDESGSPSAGVSGKSDRGSTLKMPADIAGGIKDGDKKSIHADRDNLIKHDMRESGETDISGDGVHNKGDKGSDKDLSAGPSGLRKTIHEDPQTLSGKSESHTSDSHAEDVNSAYGKKSGDIFRNAESHDAYAASKSSGKGITAGADSSKEVSESLKLKPQFQISDRESPKPDVGTADTSSGASSSGRPAADRSDMREILLSMSLKSEKSDMDFLPQLLKKSGILLEKKLSEIVRNMTSQDERGSESGSGGGKDGAIRPDGKGADGAFLRNLSTQVEDNSASPDTFKKLDTLVHEDMKGAALNFISGDKLGSSEEAKVFNEFIQNLENVQLVNSHMAESGKYIIPFPLFIENQFSFGQIFVDLGKKGGDSNSKDNPLLRISILLEMTALGPIRADFSVLKNNITGRFLVSEEEIAGHFRDGLPELRERLGAHGYNVHRIDCTVVEQEKLDEKSILSDLMKSEAGGFSLTI